MGSTEHWLYRYDAILLSWENMPFRIVRDGKNWLNSGNVASTLKFIESIENKGQVKPSHLNHHILLRRLQSQVPSIGAFSSKSPRGPLEAPRSIYCRKSPRPWRPCPRGLRASLFETNDGEHHYWCFFGGKGGELPNIVNRMVEIFLKLRNHSWLQFLLSIIDQLITNVLWL